MKYKIGLIIPFYGKWPAYYNLFLKGCIGKPIDILIFTDMKPTGNEPGNVKIIPFTLKQLIKEIKKKLFLEPAIENSYKLCDFRPAFGLIFEKYLKEYDFWGWGDLDVIYGDTSRFLTSELLKKHDVISMRKHWVSGSFSLFKNTEMINHLFQINDDYIEVFKNRKHYSFGECSKKWNQLRAGHHPNQISWNISNTTLHVLNAQKKGQLKCFFDDIIKESIPVGDYVKFENGKIIDSQNKHYLLYHFISEKKNITFSYPNWKKIPDEFYIDKYGFYYPEEFENLKINHLLRKIKSQPGYIKYYFKMLKNKINF